MSKENVVVSAVSITPALLAATAAEYDNFGHEMRVKAVLEENGCSVEHGWTYIDPVEDKPRQFDLRAHFCPENEMHQVRMAVECKNLSAAAPLLISGTKRRSTEAFLDYIVSDGTEGCRPSVIAGARGGSLYPADSFVGKSLLLTKPEKDRLVPAREEANSIYNRWSQALASAVELCGRAALAGKDTGRKIKTLVLPIVVVPNSALWILEYDRQGKPIGDPSEVTNSSLFLKHKVVVPPGHYTMNLSHVNFFTVAGLSRFLETLRVGVVDWEDIFPPQ